ncbi:DUF927 domain-containing protein [Mesorhizobium sp. B2-4-13]|uniref:DUF927 domain-containing protein n=1 Tax=Mesorhizobium sp. B2-4-13 TaxID=2589936 RepID=UPI001154CB0E|nr:DUF927 domain-containing protein [Mesorhizobium sp. B2-4-13]TPK86992.1 DUF927 domain-containing protein [Mesorhizobium sp. B2-4-13]
MTLENNSSRPARETANALNHDNAKVEVAIVDLVEDQNGTHWVCYGTALRSIWFSIQELHAAESGVLAKLAGAGCILLTTKSKNRFKKQIEDAKGYRLASVAAHPGWCGQSFVFGDRTVVSPKHRSEKIIVAFQRDPRFEAAGTLEAWMTEVGRIIAGQPLPLAMLAYSFVPPLLRFVPEGTLNPQIELVGDRETGKSTVAVLAASVWSGKRNSDSGGGQNWNRTLGSLDPLKESHADVLLMLDEANSAGSNAREKADLLQAAAFRFASTGTRTRLTDPVSSTDVRVALLSTSNEPLSRLIKASKEIVDAVSSRMVTINVDKTKGVLATVPDGFEDASEAVATLRGICAKNYGHPGRAFVVRLIEAASEDENAIQEQISKWMALFLDKLSKHLGKDASSVRVKKVFAMMFAAGMLARKWDLLPNEWGSLTKSLLDVFDQVEGRSAKTAATGSSALERVAKYVQKQGDAIVRVKTLSGPVSLKKFSGSPGYLIRATGRKALLIPSERFRAEFEDHKAIMQQLRRLGLAKTERGKNPKLTIKTPSKICAKGRVYWIYLDTD